MALLYFYCLIKFDRKCVHNKPREIKDFIEIDYVYWNGIKANVYCIQLQVI